MQAGNVTIKVGLDAKAALTGLDNIKKKTAGLSWKGITSGSDAAQKLATSFTKVGDSLTKYVTAPLLALGGISIKAATDIDSAMGNIRKTVDGTAQQYQELHDKAIEFSKVNAVSAEDMLNIESLGAQLGFAITELDEFGKVASGLDIATDMNAEEAATNMAQFANITKMSHDQISNYASTIVDLGNHFATTESAVSDMAMRVAAAGTQSGMSQADILGLSTALSSMGINAEAGGTAISTIISQIDKDVATNSDSLQTWAETAGMSTEDFAAAWKNNAAGALADVLAGMENATESGGNMNIMLDNLGISALRQTDVMKRLAGNSDLVKQAVSEANQAWSDNTALTTEVANKNDTLSAKMEMLKNKGIAIAEQIGKPLADALLEAADAAQPLFDWLENLIRGFADADEGTQKLIISLVGMAAAAGPVLKVAGKIMTAIPGIAKALDALSKATALTKLGVSALDAADKVKVFSAAMGGPVMLAATVAAAGLALAIGSLVDLNNKMEAARTYSKKLDDAVAGVGLTVEAVTDSTDYYSAAFQRVADASDGWIEKQQELAQSIHDRDQEAVNSTATAQAYAQIIEDLGGRTDLTSTQVAQLQAAVANFNDAAGTSYTVAQDASGAYQVMGDNGAVAADQLWDMVDAMKAQALANAYQQDYADAVQNTADAQERAAASAQAYYTERDRLYSSDHGAVTETERQGLEQLRYEMDNNAEAAQNAQQQQDFLAEKMGIASAAASSSADAWTRLVGSNTDLQAGLYGSNQSMTDFITGLQNSGFAVDDFSGLTSEKMQFIAQNFDGTSQSIIDAMNIATNTTDDAFAQMWYSTDGSIEQMKGKIGEYNNTPINGKRAYIDSSSIDEAKRKLTGFQRAWSLIGDNLVKTITMRIQQQGSASRAGFVHAHADGFIATGPMLTPYGLIGESGAEAYTQGNLVPLTNKTYATPFARNIAEQLAGLLWSSPGYSMGRQMLWGGNAQPVRQYTDSHDTTVNVYIDGAEVNGSAEIESTFYAMMQELNRLHRMNGGR